MKKRAGILLLCLLMLLGTCVYGAEGTEIPEIVLRTPGSEKWNSRIDYSDSANWLSMPERTEKEADLIYFYPTSYSPAPGSGSVISDIDDAGMRRMAPMAFDKQATAFAQSCDLYAPFYRQLDASYALTLSEAENDELFHYVAAQDAANALDYYFTHCNNGRPFILAGHSQGAETVLYLLSDYFSVHPDYYARMIAAYPIGYSVTESYLAANPHLKFASGETDTGVIISWNTEGPENIGQFNGVVLPGARSINPLNWCTDGTYASAQENKGSRINGQILSGIADAQIDTERGTLITHADKQYAMPPSALFGPASFHLNDFDLFYVNIQENAAGRIDAFLRTDGGK